MDFLPADMGQPSIGGDAVREGFAFVGRSVGLLMPQMHLCQIRSSRVFWLVANRMALFASPWGPFSTARASCLFSGQCPG